MFEARPLSLEEVLQVRRGSVVNLPASSAEVLQAELEASDWALSPTTALLVEGRPLPMLCAADAAATVVQLVGGAVWLDREHFTVLARSARGWEVLDAAECLDRADLVARISGPQGWLEVLVLRVAGFALVLLADPSGERELDVVGENGGSLFGQTGAAWRCALRLVHQAPSEPELASCA